MSLNYFHNQVIMNKTKIGLGGALIGFLLVGSAHSAEMMQSFDNPSFGGNPNNAGALLQQAQLQNTHTAKSTTSAITTPTVKPLTTAERFQQTVDSLVISSLANRIVDNAFGEKGLPQDGSAINTGLNTISVGTDASGGTTVTIVDNKTGGRSVITIPSF